MARRRKTPPPLVEMEARARDAALAQGELPHVFLLRVMRGEPITQFFYDQDGFIVEKKWLPSPEDRVDAAKAAAPYHAPKLQSVRHAGADGGPIEVRESLSETEVARRIAFTLLRGAQVATEPTLDNGGT